MKSKINLAIFDADDTLIDTKKRDYFTFVYLIKKYKHFNFKYLDYGDFIKKRRRGKTAMELIDSIIPKNLANRSEILVTCIKDRNSIFENDKYLLHDQVLEGVEQVLQLLREKHIKIGIVSLRKNSNGFRKTLDRFKLSQLVEVCYCSGDLEPEDCNIHSLDNIRNINPLTSSQHVHIKVCLYKKIAASLNIQISKAIVVGDRITDLIAAKIVGAIPIGVQSGYTNGETLRKDGMAYDVIKDVTYLPLALQKLQNIENIEVGFDML